MTLTRAIEVLKYITKSPPREHGGFHEQTIAAAKRLLREFKTRKTKPQPPKE